MAILNSLDLNWSDSGESILETLSRTFEINLKADPVVNDGVTDQALALAIDPSKLKLIFLYCNSDLTVKTNSPGISCVQTLSETGTITAGTFSVTGTRPDTNVTTTVSGIAYNVTLATFQSTVLDVIFGAGNTLAAGGPFPGSAIVVTFQGAAADYPVALLTFNNAGLTGGTLGAVMTTTGVRWGNRWDFLAGEPLLWWDTALWDNPVAVTIANLYMSNASGQQANFQIRGLLTT